MSLFYLRDVCAGMAYLEERGLVHRDLAARNVLLQDNGIAKVGIRIVWLYINVRILLEVVTVV